LITKSLFDRVQRILKGKTNTRYKLHDFLFRRLITCKGCGYSLIGERQKGSVYYRCHTRDCPTTCIREDTVEERVLEKLTPLSFTKEERRYLKAKVPRLKEEWGKQQNDQVNVLELRISQARDRLNRLTDAFIDGTIDKQLFEERKAMLLIEGKEAEENLAYAKDKGRTIPDRLAEFLELAGSAYLLYKSGLSEEKRDLLRIVTSNRQVDGKNVELTLSPPFDEIAKRLQDSNSAPYRGIPRTWDRLMGKLWDWFATNPAPTLNAESRFPEGGIDQEVDSKRWKLAA
jgi:hypothetical protein